MPEVLQELFFSYEASVKRVYVDYGFRSDGLNPTALTTELGIQPSRAWAKDEDYLSTMYNPETKSTSKAWRKRPSGIWAVDTKSLATKDVEEHFIYLFERLEPRSDVIHRYLEDVPTTAVRFYIWWEPFDGHGSYSLSKKIIERALALCQYIEFGFIAELSSS